MTNPKTASLDCGFFGSAFVFCPQVTVRERVVNKDLGDGNVKSTLILVIAESGLKWFNCILTRELKETSINLVLRTISLLSKQSSHPHNCNSGARAHRTHLHLILGTGEELSAFREPLEFKASAIHNQPPGFLLRVSIIWILLPTARRMRGSHWDGRHSQGPPTSKRSGAEQRK